MKTIVKHVVIHDGCPQDDTNGERLFVQTFPRADVIVSAFLNAGYELHSRNFRVAPAIQKDGCYTFYLNGWDYLFMKQIEDDDYDDSGDVLEDVLEDYRLGSYRDAYTEAVDDMCGCDEDDEY